MEGKLCVQIWEKYIPIDSPKPALVSEYIMSSASLGSFVSIIDLSNFDIRIVSHEEQENLSDRLFG